MTMHDHVMLGDSVQLACSESGLEVLGFVVFVRTDDTTVMAEARAQIPPEDFEQLVTGYLAGRNNAPRRS